VAVRMSAGASRGRLVRQFLTESLVLATSGGAIALVLAGWGTRLIATLFRENQNPIVIDVQPDGSVLLFTRTENGASAILRVPVVGGEPRKLIDNAFDGDWSPDGKFLLYYIPDPKTGTDLWVLPEQTRKPYIFLKTDANELWGQFSPDGRWVAYQSNETGRYEIYVRPFAELGGPVPISTAGGVYPRWSRDGKELYFIAPDAKLLAVKIRATAAAVEAGAPAVLFQTQKVGAGLNVIGRGHQYDVTADGRFLINTAEPDASPITLLLNWKP